MPTLDEWESALTVGRFVIIDSTKALAQRVNEQRQSPSFNGIPKLALERQEFTPPKRIQLTSADLLLSLGRITTPRIDNLADLCSTWARLRYVWAFAPDQIPSDLRLSTEAVLIDTHQKRLLSDEIGVGMAALIVERFFYGLNPVDVNVAIRSRFIQGLQTQYSTTPDYIFERIDNNFIVVECKGTQSGFSNALSQLKRGTEQVPSLVFPGGDTPLELVIGTSMSESNTEVYVMDPPNDKQSKDDDRNYYIDNKEEFQKEIRAIQRSYLFLYLGVSGRAAEIMPISSKKERLEKFEQQYEPPHRERISEIQEEYVGITRNFSLVGDISRIEIFQGFPSDLYNRLEEDRYDPFSGDVIEYYNRARNIAREKRRRQIPETEDASTSFYDKTRNALQIQAFSRDGVMLKIEINRR